MSDRAVLSFDSDSSSNETRSQHRPCPRLIPDKLTVHNETNELIHYHFVSNFPHLITVEPVCFRVQGTDEIEVHIQIVPSHLKADEVFSINEAGTLKTYASTTNICPDRMGYFSSELLPDSYLVHTFALHINNEWLLSQLSSRDVSDDVENVEDYLDLDYSQMYSDVNVDEQLNEYKQYYDNDEDILSDVIKKRRVSDIAESFSSSVENISLEMRWTEEQDTSLALSERLSELECLLESEDSQESEED
ncbi:unnamed protein product [Soboliphyme baturini]|uniref:CS domain-containing protein n=1 Tax=Soboliphyme baturini TaxID=241478 RepID=A0A183INM4_9BILA|nr:unnamed protein product [Soboliphyme baturini]